MKVILAIIGVLLLFVTLILAAFVGYSAYRGPQFDASSRAYLDENLPPILSTWSTQELRSRASPQLLDVFNDEQARLLFRNLSTLGQLRELGDANGESNITFTPHAGRVITAAYIAKAYFEGGDAIVRARLILHDEQWKFLSFHVESPALMTMGEEIR